MGMNLIIKIYRALLMSTLFIVASACIPMQKETQCSNTEAFNATLRKCVPMVGASTGNTVFIQSKSPLNSYTTSVNSTPTTHTVAVSDTYNFSYTVYWYEHFHDSNTNTTQTTLVAINTNSYSFNPSGKPAGQYVIEAVLLDYQAVNQLDNVSWNIVITPQSLPSFSNLNPAANAFSYVNTSTSETLSANINNPDGVSGYQYVWKINGVDQGGFQTISVSSITTANQSITPNTMTQGLHTVELRIVHVSNLTSSVASQVWIINIVNPLLPMIQTAGSQTIPNIGQSITIINGIPFSDNPLPANLSGWRINSDPLNALCVSVDDADKDTIAGTDIDVEFKTAGQSLGYAIQGSGVTENQFCLDPVNLIAASSYFVLSNPDVAESKSITVVTYRTGTSTQVEAMTWNVVVRPQNIRPIISIHPTKTSSNLGCIATSPINYTGCTITQSVDVDLDGDYDPTTSDPQDVDNVVQLGLNLDYDPDIVADNDFEVIFEIKRLTDTAYQQLDGATSTFTKSDCRYIDSDDSSNSAQVPSGDKYVCQLRMDAFNSAGSLAAGSFIVQAHIIDSNAGLGWGTSPKDSNIVTWNINVIEQQSIGTVQIADIATPPASPGLTTSGYTFYTSSSGCSGGTSTTYAENGHMQYNMKIRDIERDNFRISFEMSNAINGGFSTLASTQTITRTNDTEWFTHTSCIKIPEWAVANTSPGTVSVKVTVQDLPNSATSPVCLTCDITSRTFSFTVNDKNPAPAFNINTDVDLSVNGTKVFAGMPFNIPVSTNDFFDNSVFDGNIITWQWLVSVNAGAWTEIPNANSVNQTQPSLIWTPDIAITNNSFIDLRLCLGDNGIGNELTDCATLPNTDARIKEWNNIEVFSNNRQIASTSTTNSSGNELTQWYDETNEHLYIAYTSGTRIYLEKKGFDSDGALETIHTISFLTEDDAAGKVPTSISKLSISGLDGFALVVAYAITEVINDTPQYRIRRLDIADGKFSFHYCGMYNPTPAGLHDPACANNDLIDDANNTLFTNTDIAVSSPNTGRLDITFNAFPIVANTDLALVNSLGNTIIYRYGAANNLGANPKVIGYCNGTCTDTNTSALALADAIMNTAIVNDLDVETIAKEFYASSTVGSSTTNIHGPKEFDYYDNTSKITPYVGHVMVRSDNSGEWILPYADASSSMQLGLGRGNGVTLAQGLVGGTTPSNTIIAGSGVNLQELASVYSNNGRIYVAARNANSNLDIYNINPTTLTLTSSVLDAYTMSGYSNIQNISLSLGDNQATPTQEFVYVGNISTKNSNQDRNLALCIFSFNLSSQKCDIEIASNIFGYEDYVQNLSRVSISADPRSGEEGKLIAAITTNSDNINPNNSYVIKLSAPVNSSSITSNSFILHNYNYPKLNIFNVQSGAIHASNIITLTNKSYTNVSSIAEDLSRPVLFFGQHESDGGNKIRTGFYNIQNEQIMTNSTSVSGSYPAFIGQ